jgi:hypothetical protein
LPQPIGGPTLTRHPARRLRSRGCVTPGHHQR